MRNEEAMCEGLLSVVIPVYNIRDYVERCVRSVLAQPDVPLEVLIVDDGSTDDSGAVCDALAAEDSRVTVIHKPNGGLSDARNYGLCHAQGEYILFMDGDDWLAENVCPGLLHAFAQPAHHRRRQAARREQGNPQRAVVARHELTQRGHFGQHGRARCTADRQCPQLARLDVLQRGRQAAEQQR